MTTPKRRIMQALTNNEGKDGQPIFNEKAAEQLAREIVQNAMLSRTQFLNRLLDPKRDYDKECGFPTDADLTPQYYANLYGRHAVAARVVGLMPAECWQKPPEIFEDEDPNLETPFELAWKDLGRSLRGESWFQDQEGNPIWEHIARVDLLSGKGSFGLLLMGIDDGKPLQEPIDGFEDDTIVEQGQEFVSNAPPMPFKKKAKPKKQDPESQGPLEQPQEQELEGDPRDPHMVELGSRDNGVRTGPLKGQFPNEQAQESVEAEEPDQAQGEQAGEEEPNEGTQDVGTDGELPPNADGAEQPQAVTKHRLLFLRCFSEELIQITRWEQNRYSPRYGMPVEYVVKMQDLNKPTTTGSGMATSDVRVHWSRVIHVADTLESSEIFGCPRMRPVVNNLISLVKLYGGSGEMYWKGAFPGIAAETHPQLGTDVKIPKEQMQEQLQNYFNGLQRSLAMSGMSWRTLAPTVVDPTSQITVQIQAICIVLGCPQRIFMGSERGELASSQDDDTWSDRVQERRTTYLTPRLIVPFIDRLIKIGVLPEPQGYSVVWPDVQEMTKLNRANLAVTQTGAMAQYVSGSLENLIQPMDWLTTILGLEEDVAESILQNTQEMAQQQAAMGGDTGITLDPNTGQYVDAQGQPVETDEMGQPINPVTGQSVPVDPQTGEPQPLPPQGQVDPETGEPIPQEEQLDEEGNPIEQQADSQLPEDQSQAGGEEGEEGDEATQEVDEDTGLPVDPQSGMLIYEEQGQQYLVDPDDYTVYDPESGEPVGKLSKGDQEQPQEGEEQPPEEEDDEPVVEEDEEDQ